MTDVYLIPMRVLPAILIALTLSAAIPLLRAPAHAQDGMDWIQLDQSAEAVLAHQRLAGNARAQAKRRGVIRTVPHLFVYHRDGTPAFHMDGLRPGFERQLNLLIDAFRIDRSMVELETLLENAERPDNEPITLDDLVPNRITLTLYTRAGCADCDAVRERLEKWLEDREAFDPNRLLIRMP